jgi:aerobic carbon-monoxide dehydrogenase medium subunit
MFTRPFRYDRAERLGEASDLLRRHGEDAKVIAGGQSLMPLINLGVAAPQIVIDISRADRDGLPRAIGSDDGYLTVGALVTHARLAADPVAARKQPLLGAAAARIGNSRVRNRGTLGGSLAHSDPAAELPLAMVALGAEYEVSNGERIRSIRAEEFHLGFLTTPLDADELIISARVPSLGPGWGWAFQEFSRRDGDFALAAAAALVRSSGGAIVESRVAVGGVNDRPVRLADIEIALTGATTEDAADRVGALRGISPVSDTGASADYRAHLAQVLVKRAVTEACQRSESAHV